MTDQLKTIRLETDVILLIMATDFDDFNIDIQISLRPDIRNAINLLVDAGDDTDLDPRFIQVIGKMTQRHLLHHVSWLNRAMAKHPKCSDICAAKYCLEDIDILACPREDWRDTIIHNVGYYLSIPVLPRKAVVDKCMTVIAGIMRISNLGRMN